MKDIFLNLACGTDVRDPPFINLDIVEKWPNAKRACDIVWDARRDKIPFPDNSVNHVYAGYLLLHLQLRYHPFVLSEILRVLKPSAAAIFREIDYAKLAPAWLADPSNPYLIGLMWGEQGTEHGEEFADADKHCTGFTLESLAKTLMGAGFRAWRPMTDNSDVFYDLAIEVAK